MSKILYPVGTKVILSEYADKDPRELTPLYVVEYRKGKKFPYGVSKTEGGSPETLKGHKWRSVKGLKRYNPTQAKATQTGSDVASPVKDRAEDARQEFRKDFPEVYTREEVDTLLAQQYQDLLELVATVDGVAYEAFQKVNRVAKVVDANFGTVARQFKTLNHDDD